MVQVTSSGSSPAVLASMMVAARRWRTQERAESPVVVVSCDGVAGAGPWCAAAQCWDMLSSQGGGGPALHLAHAVTSVRASRPALVRSLAEYALTRDIVRGLVTTGT